jgi:hypothetical protein
MQRTVTGVLGFLCAAGSSTKAAVNAPSVQQACNPLLSAVLPPLDMQSLQPAAACSVSHTAAVQLMLLLLHDPALQGKLSSYSCPTGASSSCDTAAPRLLWQLLEAHLLELHDVWVHQTSVIEDLALYVLGDLHRTGAAQGRCRCSIMHGLTS